MFFLDELFQDCDEGVVQVASRAGKRSRASSTTGSKKKQASAADLVELGKPAAANRRGRVYTWAMKLVASTRNTVCGACGFKDSDNDPASPEHNRAWGQYQPRDPLAPEIQLITEGGTCWYCLRVFQVRYSDSRTLSAWKKALASDDALHTEYKKFYHWIIARVASQLAEGVDRDDLMKIQWPTPWLLKQVEIVEVVWTPPAGYFKPFDEYVKEKGGEPAPHLVVLGPKKQKFVKVSTDDTWKREVRMIQRAQKERIVADGEGDQDQEAVMGDRMSSLAGTLTGALRISMTQ